MAQAQSRQARQPAPSTKDELLAVPSDIAAEEAVLALLMDTFSERCPEYIRLAYEASRVAVLADLKPEDFSGYRQTIFAALKAIYRAGESFSVADVLEKLLPTCQPDEFSYYRGYLPSLFTVDIAPSQGPQYAKRVREAATRRRLIQAAGEIARLAYDRHTPVDDAVAKACELVGGATPAQVSDGLHGLDLFA